MLARYVRYLDRRIDQLLRLYQRTPNVVIVSDHGNGATTFSTDWRGWHTSEAIVVASGSSIPQTPTPLRISYYDVLPTMLALSGFERPSGLGGRSFLPTQPR